MNNDTVDIVELNVQQELPFAYVRGEALIKKPEDLYIPPEALEVILEAFEGPLDLLLYLIRKQKFDILDLPIRQITAQYMEYVDVMKDINLELAAEYLVMAAILAEIKSKLLLPVSPSEETEEDDPRALLIKRLQEYDIYKSAAINIDNLARQERDFYVEKVSVADNCQANIIYPELAIQDLAFAFSQILKRADNFKHHQIKAENLSTRERMANILSQLTGHDYLPFESFFTIEEGKQGVVVTFLAILELVKESLIEIIQNQDFANIHIKSV